MRARHVMVLAIGDGCLTRSPCRAAST